MRVRGTLSMTPALSTLRTCLAAAEPAVESLDESIRSKFLSFGDFTIDSTSIHVDKQGAHVCVRYDRLIYERVSGDQIRTSVTLEWARSSKKLEITINDVVVMRRAVVLTNDLVVGIVNGIGKALARASSDTEALNQSLKDSARAIETNLQADIGKLLKTPKMPPLLQFAELQWEVERRD